MQTNNVSILDWATNHIQLIGWPTLILATFRLTRFFTKLETRAVAVEDHVTKMATNCFPTMQASLQTQDSLLKSMDESLKALASKKKK